MQLFLPAGYVKTQTCTCGSAEHPVDFVPDTLWGLSVKEACCIHDFMYSVGQTQKDKEEADRIFLENMLRIIDAKTKNWLLRKLRRNRAWVYYQAVYRFGGPFFWTGKNRQLPDSVKHPHQKPSLAEKIHARALKA